MHTGKFGISRTLGVLKLVWRGIKPHRCDREVWAVHFMQEWQKQNHEMSATSMKIHDKSIVPSSGAERMGDLEKSMTGFGPWGMIGKGFEMGYGKLEDCGIHAHSADNIFGFKPISLYTPESCSQPRAIDFGSEVLLGLYMPRNLLCKVWFFVVWFLRRVGSFCRVFLKALKRQKSCLCHLSFYL